MDKTIPPAEARRSNSSKIYHYIYAQRGASRTDMAKALQLSLPTVTQHLQAFMQEGLIEKGGLCESTGGRKAQAYQCNAAYRYAIGADIWKDHVEIVLLDLYGAIVAQRSVPMAFENTPAYCQRLCALLRSLPAELSLPQDAILGAGISVQGVVSPDGERILYGDAMNTVGLSRQTFADALPWPCLLAQNVEVAAYAERWYRGSLTDAFFFSLNDHFGAALIVKGAPYLGDAHLGSAIEHMCLVPDGQPCYCGKRGCVEAYCSANSLFSAAQEDCQDFFRNLRAGEPKETTLWAAYLRKLALVIDNIRMVLHSQVILGGFLAGYLTDGDLLQLEQYVNEQSAFKNSGHFISMGICGRSCAAKGAALKLVDAFLASI